MGKRAPPLRTSYCTSVGRAALSPPPDNHHIPGRARGPCPTKNTIVGRDPCVPPFRRTPCKKPVIARPARTLVVAIRTPCPRATARVAPTLPLSAFSFSLFHPSHAKFPPEASASGGNSYAQFQFFLKTPRRRSAPPGTAPAPRAHTHTGPRCTTGRPGSCGCRC